MTESVPLIDIQRRFKVDAVLYMYLIRTHTHARITLPTRCLTLKIHWLKINTGISFHSIEAQLFGTSARTCTKTQTDPGRVGESAKFARVENVVIVVNLQVNSRIVLFYISFRFISFSVFCESQSQSHCVDYTNNPIDAWCLCAQLLSDQNILMNSPWKPFIYLFFRAALFSFSQPSYSVF